jgi:uncharacterized protein (DUF1778 family)
MLTPEHKNLIEQAAKLDFSDVSGWVRPILIQAAQARVAKEEPKKANHTKTGKAEPEKK